MTALIRSILPTRGGRQAAMGLDEWVGMFSFDNIMSMLNTTMTGEEERPNPSYMGLVYGAYLRNPIVFACLTLRARLFSEARFQFQQMRAGRPGNLFGTSALSVLENPETGKTTGDLMAAAILDADLGGDGLILGRPDRLLRLRPDWTTITWASKSRSSELGSWDPEASVLGYGYQPGGLSSTEPLLVYGPDEVAHFVTSRHPLARNRGVSLLAAGLREVMGDNAATGHKLMFFEHAATPNLVMKLPPGMSKEKAQEFIELWEQDHRGGLNAYRTLWLGGGLDATPVGLNFEQMTFTEMQGKAETRIASLTGMHPVVAALSEGLSGSSLNAGNFQNAARLVGNATLRPLWRNFAGSMQTILPPLPGTRLWYDDRDVPFLRDDIKDRATVMASEATMIKTLGDAGYEKPSIVDAVMADGDWNRLIDTGLNSVQLQPPLDPAAAVVAPAAYRVRETFSADAGPADASARVALGALQGEVLEAGTVLPAGHPFVRAFPSLFEREDAPLAAYVVRGQLGGVTRATIMATRARLLAAGRPAGYESLAHELCISRETVRRRLAQSAV